MPSDAFSSVCWSMTAIGALAIGLLVGGLAVFVFMRERLAALRPTRAELGSEIQALSAEVLRQSRADFLAQLEGLQAKATSDLDERRRAVDDLVRPIKESLERVG